MLFPQVFSCCLGKRSHEPDVADDRSRLIPASIESSYEESSDVVAIDHRKLKQKWSSIVRDKEGKMVNVSSALPFNLHNKSLSALDPSSSRSASTTRESQSPQTYRPPTRSGLSITPIHSDEPSRSRNTSRSRSSSPIPPRRRHGVQFADSQSEDVEPSTPRPILNIRLVRGCGFGIGGRRGRARLKAGEPTHSSAAGLPRGDDHSSASQDKGKSREISVEKGQLAGMEQNPLDVLEGFGGVCSPSNGDEPALLQGDQPNTSPCSPSFPQLSISPASDIDFRIQEMGAITLSWDD